MYNHIEVIVMDKLKDALLIIIGIVSTLIVVYFTFIDPIASGISKYGIMGFLGKVACGFLILYIIYTFSRK